MQEKELTWHVGEFHFNCVHEVINWIYDNDLEKLPMTKEVKESIRELDHWLGHA